MPYDEGLLRELRLRANDIRQAVIRMTCAAGSGHPGGSLSEADILAALYFRFLRVDPRDPAWAERDRFILSKGHACPGLYAALALRGFFPLEVLSTLRRAGSILQGHPDMNKVPGVEMSSGPLGNGLAAGVGMALGARLTGRPARVVVLIGDGDSQEGCTWEAAMFAGFHRLTNLVCIHDYNRSQVDGRTSEVLDLEPVAGKWRAFGWDVREIDGHDMAAILDALAWSVAEGPAWSVAEGPARAAAARERPAFILAHTIKGKGVSFMEDDAAWHGTAPDEEQAARALAELARGAGCV